MGLSNLNGRGFSPTKYFGYLNATKNYLKFLSGQGVAWPDYATRNQWDNFFRYIAPNIGPVPRNLAAYYNVQDLSSMRNSAGAVPSNGDGIKLIGDKSGNSLVNCLCLNGASGNYGSSPSAAPLNITGTIEAQVLVRLPSWAPATTQTLCAKWDAAGNRSYTFQVSTTGALTCIFTEDGTTQNVFTSSVVTGFAAFAKKYLSFVMVPNNGAGVSTGTFYTSDDGTNWTQLGATVNGTVRSGVFSGTSVFCIGALNVGTGNNTTGNIESVKIYNGDSRSAGTLVFDANFATATKLATSFTESSSNAATVTINSTGDLGARICGERDLYQGTSSKQPMLTVAAGGNYLTFDGANDYMKTAAFSLAQPITIYFCCSQVTWTSGDNIYDGNSASERMVLGQRTATPQIQLFAGTANAAVNSGLALATRGVILSVYNGATSLIRVNRGVPTTGSPGANSANGFTLGADVVGNNPGNITASEIAIYSENHSTAVQDLIISALSSKYSIPL